MRDTKYITQKILDCIKDEKNLEFNKENDIQNLEVVSQLRDLKDLHDQGIINDDEFKKAKDKLLN